MGAAPTDSNPASAGGRNNQRRGSKLRRLLISLALGLTLLAVLLAGWVYITLTGSLPQLDGEIELAGLTEKVVVTRDDLGIPTIEGQDRRDVSRALGFVHAQDRFFQMDLMRRQAAGTLAELLGPALLPIDRDHRVHRFRARAARVMSALAPYERSIAAAYSEGVNAGLDTLSQPPFEYRLLRATPEPWQPEDIALVAYSMYLDLNDQRGEYESARGLVYDLLGSEVFEFLFPLGTEWDAPVTGESFDVAPIPGPDVVDLRNRPPTATADLSIAPAPEMLSLGSNNWAVSGRLTRHGGALLANDMHLRHSVPNIWYRATLSYPKPTSESAALRLTGVSLPGTPFIIAGSNGSVAWGHTNTWGDWQDLVVVDSDAGASDTYSTPDGARSFEIHREELRSSNGESEVLEVFDTIWGPVIDVDHLGRRRSLRWIAHDPEAISFALLDVEIADTVETAMAAANRVGAPPQNFVVGDSSGAIGWTVMGPMPERFGFSGRLPTSWAEGSRGWSGYLKPERYPRISSPDIDRIWTANARVVGGEWMSRIGQGGYRLGARASQIRDRLQATDQFDEATMLELQLDDRALFLGRWQELLLSTLTHPDVSNRFEPLAHQVQTWGARASIDSVGYLAVREFRREVAATVLGSLTAPCKSADPSFDFTRILQYEGPLWRIVVERPPHLLDSSFSSWNDLLLTAAQRVLERLEGSFGDLADATWGNFNTVTIRHPLFPALPALAPWLDMSSVALPGDSNMPRFQSRRAGASERMVVAPGREQHGLFHMPTGQSGHPLSPHYRDEQNSWAIGARTPLLPGPARHTLLLTAD